MSDAISRNSIIEYLDYSVSAMVSHLMECMYMLTPIRH